MSDTRKRCLIVFVAITLVLLIFIGTGAYLFYHHRIRPIGPFDSCPRPKQFKSNYDFVYSNISREFRNVNSSIDYFRLILSWSPTFCAGQKNRSQKHFQCQHQFDFIVHGLWPNSAVKKVGYRHHPRNCRDESMLSTDLIRKYFCLIPSETLMQAEWEKHGTCYWKEPKAYFEQIKKLRAEIQTPTNMDELLAFNGTKSERQNVIKDAFLKINPKIKSDTIDVIMSKKGQKLREIAFCYDLQFHYTACNQNPTS